MIGANSHHPQPGSRVWVRRPQGQRRTRLEPADGAIRLRAKSLDVFALLFLPEALPS